MENNSNNNITTVQTNIHNHSSITLFESQQQYLLHNILNSGSLEMSYLRSEFNTSQNQRMMTGLSELMAKLMQERGFTTVINGEITQVASSASGVLISNNSQRILIEHNYINNLFENHTNMIPITVEENIHTVLNIPAGTFSTNYLQLIATQNLGILESLSSIEIAQDIFINSLEVNETQESNINLRQSNEIDSTSLDRQITSLNN